MAKTVFDQRKYLEGLTAPAISGEINLPKEWKAEEGRRLELLL